MSRFGKLFYLSLALMILGLCTEQNILVSSPTGTVPHAGMIRNPDVSASHIAFRYADDLWLVPRDGGAAKPLASPPGEESFPRFNQDGSLLAFLAHYEGDPGIYIMPVNGGIPKRLTHHPPKQMLCDWTPEGRLLYYTSARNGLLGRTELFTISANGGMPTPVDVPYGAEAAISSDGRWLAYTPVVPLWVGNWKRYVGGSASDIWLKDLRNETWRKLTSWKGSDMSPMWHKGILYYLSDAGPEHRDNLWMYNIEKDEHTQLTQYSKFDVVMPSMGPGSSGGGEIIFSVGETLHLFDLTSREDRIVEVTIPGARSELRPRNINVSEAVRHYSVSPGGKRLAVEARGDIWTLPAKHGVPRNLTQTSGVAERYPSWSPDGRWIAYFSDRSGEYELYLIQSDGKAEERQITSGNRSFFFPLTWSPDSKHLVFQEKTGELWLCKIHTSQLTLIAVDPWTPTNPGDQCVVSFSPDSRWIAFDRSEPSDSGIRSLWLYHIPTSKLHRITSALADESLPVFGRDGKYLYFAARRSFKPTYSEVEFAWAYENTELLMAIPLCTGVERPFTAISDEVDWENNKKEINSEFSNNDVSSTEIELAGLQARAYKLPAAPGSFEYLGVNDAGQLIYLRNSGGNSGDKTRVQLLDPKDREAEEKLVVENVQEIVLSPDGATLAGCQGEAAVPNLYPATAEASGTPPVTEGMLANVEPRAEWEQVFTDTWRLYRDFFYDPHMHGLDWQALRKQYAAMLPDCASRADLTFVIEQMIGELNVSHSRYRPPTEENKPKSPGIGLIGADFELANGGFRFSRIYQGPVWEPDICSPLAEPGVDVSEGEYLLAVNGVPVNTAKDPWVPFVGLAGLEVKLTIGPDPVINKSAREVIVKTRDFSWDQNLRYRAWVEDNRQYVDEKSQGRIGYVHLPNYIPSGLNLLMQQYFPQQNKEAMIIDQRFNGGGWTPHRFLEILNRPPMMYRARRHGLDKPVPSDAHFGPKCLLMNMLSGSSGDLFPWMFRHAKLGPLIGTRTWGGVVGLSGNPRLIDGSYPLIPNNGTYTADGRWIIEGWGVEPDILVKENPSALMAGIDVQLEKAIEEMLRALEKPHFTPPSPPQSPDRTGMGIPEKER